MRNLMEKQLSWLALLITAFYSLLGSCRSQEPCGHERLVKCARPLERLGDRDFDFTMKKQEFQRLCPHFEAAIKCIQTYTVDCLQEEQREHFKSLYTATNKVVMELCQDGPYHDEFLRHISCLQKVQPDYELCQKKYAKTMHEIETKNQTSGVLKSVCCAFKEFSACSHHTVRRQCGDDTAQFTKETLDRMSSSLQKVHCGSYTDEVCAMGSSSSLYRVQAMVVVILAMLARYFT